MRRAERRSRTGGACLLLLIAALSASAAPRAVSLNEATPEQLLAVPGVDERMAEKILYLRQQLGGYASVRQLLSIPGMTPEVFARVEPYFFVAPKAGEAESPDAPEGLSDEGDSLLGSYLGDAGDVGEEGSSLDTPVTGDGGALEELREKPVDLNRADEAKLRELPGIDRRLARRILRERARKQKFSSVNDLLQVNGVEPALLDRIRPFVKVKTASDRGAFFAGDTRVRMRNVNPRGSSLLGAPERFQNNTYVYNRTRLRFGEQSQVGWLSKRSSVGAPLTPENLQRLAVLKFSVQESDLGYLDNVIVGNYTLSHGQGLVFYDGLGEFVRPVKVKGRGAKPDFTSGSNEYHKGVVLAGRVGEFDAELFVSNKDLDFKVEPDGTVDADLNSLRQALGDLQDEEAIANNDRVSERLYGGRLAYSFLDNATVGFTGYESHYSHPFDQAQTTFNGAHVFRGDKNVIGGVDFDGYYKTLNVFGEVARSRSSGPGVAGKSDTAWTVTPLFHAAPVTTGISFFDYGPDFFTRHGKGISYAVVGAPEELTDNQRGAVLWFFYEGRKYSNKTNYYVARFPEPLGDGDSTAPAQASEGRQIYFENAYKVARSVELYFRYQRSLQDSYRVLSVDGRSTGVRRITPSDLQKFRYQVTWNSTPRVRYRLRYETRHEDVPETSNRLFGHLLMGDVRFKPSKGLTLHSRLYFFDSPEASLSTGVEEIWNGTIYYRLAGAMNSFRGTPGSRFYLMANQKIGPDLELWFKYDVNHRPGDLRTIQNSVSAQEDKAFGATRQGFHMQVDYKWGGSTRRHEDDPEFRAPSGVWDEKD